MSLEVKTCQPFIAAFDSPSLTLNDIKSVIPEATAAYLIFNDFSVIDEKYLYLYYVYAGDIATFKKAGAIGDRAILALKESVAVIEYDDTASDIVLPTSLVKYYIQYDH